MNGLTVKELCECLQQVMEHGKGDYKVTVNTFKGEEGLFYVMGCYNDGKEKTFILEADNYIK